MDSERFDPNNALAKACQKPVHHIEHQYHHQTQTLELAKRNASGKNMKTYETYEFLETNSQRSLGTKDLYKEISARNGSASLPLASLRLQR